jgi:response regulator of citrate/malate metabolism
MGKRKYVLDPLATFQRKLEEFFKVKEIHMQEQRQASQAYLDTVYRFHLKGLSLREIEEATGIPKATVHQWIKKMKKAKEKEALPEASDYIKEAKKLKASMEQPQS